MVETFVLGAAKQNRQPAAQYQDSAASGAPLRAGLEVKLAVPDVELSLSVIGLLRVS